MQVIYCMIDSRDKVEPMGHLGMIPVCPFPVMVQWDRMDSRDNKTNGVNWDDPSPSVSSIGTVGHMQYPMCQSFQQYGGVNSLELFQSLKESHCFSL